LLIVFLAKAMSWLASALPECCAQRADWSRQSTHALRRLRTRLERPEGGRVRVQRLAALLFHAEQLHVALHQRGALPKSRQHEEQDPQRQSVPLGCQARYR
jgi:hypothetical protein